MKSMTGYGKATYSDQRLELEVEVKSLNHRFLEAKLILPGELNFLEHKLRKLVGKFVNRGKLDLRIKLRDKRLPEIELDEARLTAFANVYRQAATTLGQESDLRLDLLVNQPGIINLKIDNMDEDALITPIIDTCTQALTAHSAMALTEGTGMKEYFIKSLEHMGQALVKIEEAFPQYKTEVFERLRRNLKEVLQDSLTEEDYRRIHTETAVYVERSDITEEIVRFKNHLQKFTAIVKKDVPEAGKSLNFILQEMHREANTIGSKFNSADVFDYVLVLKQEIEKCREIVQNVE